MLVSLSAATACSTIFIRDSEHMSLYISHRGESADAPENTLPAFRLSNERDTDGMETDIHLTSDGMLVCSHDSDTKRMANGVSCVIEEYSFEFLETLDVSGKHAAYRGARIPLFAESLETLKPGRKYFVEIKADDENVLREMKRTLEIAGTPMEQIVVISFHANMIAACRRLMPDTPALWLTWWGFDKNGVQNKTADDIFATLERINATGLDIGGAPELLTKEFLAEVKRRGYYLAVWTIDTPDRCRFFEEAGVDAITSNKAATMKAVLHGEGR